VQAVNELAPRAEGLPEGVLRAILPTPFPVGPVNCYLLPGDPVTLVDPGMVIPESTALLEAMLGSAGLSLAEVAQVVVTHGHPDHFGAAGWVAERSGAVVLSGEAERARILNLERPGWLELLADLGIPESFREALPAVREAMRDMLHPLEPSALRAVADGDLLAAGGRSWTVLETPGHAVGHVSLWDPESGTLLSGDHLLPQITPNPFVEVDDGPTGRRQSLIEYLDSLDRFVALDPAVGLPGHGPAYTGVPGLVDRLRRHHSRRADQILAEVAELGEPTPYEVSCRLFPDLVDFGVVLGISEVTGHLDLLVAQGRAVQVDNRPVRFAALKQVARSSDI
jgi:glyoxylase-like metal-dependent hydrolase (beta-lactamase superfamily II)